MTKIVTTELIYHLTSLRDHARSNGKLAGRAYVDVVFGNRVIRHPIHIEDVTLDADNQLVFRVESPMLEKTNEDDNR